jgi:hypothetical protein
MTTVGYGDKYPKTVQGSFIGVSCMFSGILLIALPTAIVGQNFQEVYRDILNDQQSRLKRKGSKTGLSISAISNLKRRASTIRRNSQELDSSPSVAGGKSSGQPRAVSWRRIQLVTERSNARKEKLKALQVREQRIQEELKAEIRSLVQILESHPLRTESVT